MERVFFAPLELAGAVDRSAERRLEDDLLRLLASDPRTRVLLVDRDRIPVDRQGRPLVTPAVTLPGDLATAGVGYLGEDEHGALLVAAVHEQTDDDPASLAPLGVPGWASLRDVAATADAATAAVLVEAVALARWYVEAPFCPRCGGPTVLTTAGWARVCTQCGREHFPRTDPAVIVAVSDGDRLLLGSNAMWPHGRFSCFAGFVEAGESLESAVRREVAEESGITVAEMQYSGSQGWPYPRSLMLGFHATASADTAQADGEEILEVRWFDRDEIRAALQGAGTVSLPGRASIAHALIVEWLEGQA